MQNSFIFTPEFPFNKCALCKKIILAMFSFRKCQESVRRETTEGSLLNLLGIGFHGTSKMASKSYSQGINQQKRVRLFQYSDWLSR